MDSLTQSTTLDSGLLFARLMFGTLIAAHGAQKLFGWFGGYGLAGTGGFMESMGFRPGRAFAAAAGAAEFLGGILLALGLFGPIGPVLILSVMIVAAVTVHWKNGLFATTNGVEVTLLYAIGAVTLALTGPGFYSLDAALDLDRMWTPALRWAAIAGGLLAGAVNLGLRRSVTTASAA